MKHNESTPFNFDLPLEATATIGGPKNPLKRVAFGQFCMRLDKRVRKYVLHPTGTSEMRIEELVSRLLTFSGVT